MSERELAANLYLIDMTVLELLIQFLLQTGNTAHELLISSMYIHVQMENRHKSMTGMRGISAGQDICRQHPPDGRLFFSALRTVISLHRAHDLVAILQIGMNIDLTT